MNTGFFAYTTKTPSSAECIREAIQQINDGGSCSLISWESLTVSGRLIISPILQEIDKADFFCADLTGLNDNVLFETGYAIAKNKPVWLIMDSSKEKSKIRFNELGFLSTVGYTSFSSTAHLVSSFYKEKVYEKNHPLLDDLIAITNKLTERRPVLFLKSQVDTNYGQQIATDLENYRLPFYLDDANENKVQPLVWYIERLLEAGAVLAEFSSTERAGYELQNSKCAFISGLALGLDRLLLMVAEAPYAAPLDYRELLVTFDNRQALIEKTQPFYAKIREEIGEILTTRAKIRVTIKKRSELASVNFGEFIAEHETEGIPQYYVETADFNNIVRSEYNIVVGRKGTGKTAMLYYTLNRLSGDRNKFVCLIKPVNFQIDGLIELLKSKNEFEKGYLIESIWKFLIYTEVAAEIYRTINNKPAYLSTDIEYDYKNYIDANQSIFLSDFSSRLQEQVKRLLDIPSASERGDGQRDFQLKVSEILHAGVIKELKQWLAKIIQEKEQINILIDNLDKSWRKDAKLPVISQYILGLLGVTGRISKELNEIKLKRGTLKFQLTLFIRSDIFRHVIKYAREPDKIETTRLKWDDPEILFRIVEERYQALSKNEVDGKSVWRKFFPATVNGVPLKTFISRAILPRPRDLIYLLKYCKDYAVARGHEKISELDITSAYTDYSKWVFTSLLVENGVTIAQMEDFMNNLIGENKILVEDDIRKLAIKTDRKFEEDEKFQYFIEHLVGLSVLGRECGANDFRYDYDGENEDKNTILSRKYGSGRYMIHPALYPFLELKD